MPDQPKRIGVCLSQAHTYLNSGYLSELDRQARSAGYRVVVFNSSLDFFWYKQGSNIARSVFDALDPALFSALVILRESFQDPVLLRRLVDRASACQVPVMCLGGVESGCISIVNDYVDAYKAVLRHVIQEHGAMDTFFISGLPDEANSALRLQCYRETLAECGLPFLEENTAYGYYWEQPPREIVERLLSERKTMPRAIFCANDYMALSVCDTLREHGLRVPEDVIVTGFDGIPVSRLTRPQLTTCAQDPASLARLTVELISRAAAGEEMQREYRHRFLPVFSESCGCPAPARKPLDPLSLYRRTESLISHENMLYQTVERMLMKENMQDVLSLLVHSILPDSTVTLNEGFLSPESEADFERDSLEKTQLCLPFREHDEKGFVMHKVSLPELSLLSDGFPGLTMITAIHSETAVAGCYVVCTAQIEEDNQLIKRVCDVLNLFFTVLLGNIRQRRLLSDLENSAWLDPMTGLNNLQGLSRWFDGYTQDAASHAQELILSVYTIHRYSWLLDSFGISETNRIVREVSRNLTQANPEALTLARISENQFVVINQARDEAERSEIINRCVRSFYDRMGAFNARKDRPCPVEVNCGCTTMDAPWQQVSLENLIHLATGEMYLNSLRTADVLDERRDLRNEAALYNSFCLLMDKNLFRFHFQPIVDARTGMICAYEALMRTDPVIQMNPLQILSAAREYNRLDEVEKATLFGIMERVTRNYADFHNNKVFINTIPGHFLSPEDCAALISRFEGFLDCFVFELTEDAPSGDEELSLLKTIHKPGGHTQIAIDDYGTGHSNIVNLLRYAPQIIKIDRGLISDIHTDRNRQLFVRNTIEFGHQNNIHILAEGVETSEELRYVVSAGVDLIQGFYTAKPQEQPLAAIPEDIRNEILEENFRKRQINNTMQVYKATDGEELHLIDLALRNYSVIHLSGGHVTLLGEKAHAVDMLITVADRAEAALTLNQVNMKGLSGTTIRLGAASRLTLELKGKNTLHKEGIRVPQDASLLLTGEGDLEVASTRNYGVGIGGGFNDAYGSIRVDLGGTLSFRSSGDKVVCLGGGSGAGEGIVLSRGRVDVEASGINVIGVGSTLGPAKILVEKGCSLSVNVHGNDAVALGALNGDASIALRGKTSLTAESERGVALGTMSGRANIDMQNARVSVVLRCDIGSCLGTATGLAQVLVRDTALRVHGEGNTLVGFGAVEGSAATRIESGLVQADLLAGNRRLLGNEDSRFIIAGGNVQLSEEDLMHPLSPALTPLRPLHPEGDAFEQTFAEGDVSWTCAARRDENGLLTVWVP